jgi:LPPG:FO 2-phospho-L-lactate transferase
MVQEDGMGITDHPAGLPRVTALAGGVGGAKLAQGLMLALPEGSLTVIVNTGDDFDHLGLRICPDIDTVCYTLAGLANPETGWGRAGETWKTFEGLQVLGGPTWFRLGDSDLATHLERTRRLNAGQPLSQITRDFCGAWGVAPDVLPMTDDRVATMVNTTEYGILPFQEYFVKRRCEPRVQGFCFEGIEAAAPAPGVIEAITAADLIVVCPSNPWVSIAPILSVKGIREALIGKQVVAVSPIVGGQAIKGPAAKMFAEMGIVPSAAAVAEHYHGLLRGLVIDRIDQVLEETVREFVPHVLVTDTIMKSEAVRRSLAIEILSVFGTPGGRYRFL